MQEPGDEGHIRLMCCQAPAARPSLNPALTLSRVGRSPQAQGLSSTSCPSCQVPVVGAGALGYSYFCPPQMWLVGSHDVHNSLLRKVLCT